MKIYCERCTMGCELDVERIDGEIIVAGNLCNKGKLFGSEEIQKEKRRLSFKVPVEGGYFKEVKIKTDGDIESELWVDVYRIVGELELKAPIEFGEIILENILGTGVNIVSERKI